MLLSWFLLIKTMKRRCIYSLLTAFEVQSQLFNADTDTDTIVASRNSFWLNSPIVFRCIAVRTGPSSGVSILVRRPKVPSGVAPELLGDMNWGSLGGDFKEVHYSKMPGRTFVQKLFLLLAVEMYWVLLKCLPTLKSEKKFYCTEF